MVETKAFKKMREKLDRGATWVTIKGRPGEGKSTIAYMTLKNQQSQGRQVYQVVSPAEFNEVIMACTNPVILLDDIFGDLEFDTAEWAKWRPSLRPILDVKHPDKYAEKVPERQKIDQTQLKQTSPNKDKTIIILVGRDYVLKSSLADLGRMADYISSPQYVVEVSSQRDSYERKKIWRVHAEANNIDFEESVVSQICKADCPHGFPHVCKMFSTAYEKDWTHLQMQMFFQAPLDFLRQTLDKSIQDMRKRSLFMAMIKRDGKISGQELEEDDSLGYECIQAADDLVGSYLKKEDDTYMFDHPSIYDSVSFILSTKLSKFVIENCSLSFIRQRLRLASSKERENNVPGETGIVANISWTYAGHLAGRFASEIKKSNFLHVLSHQAFCNSDFVDLLMDCLKNRFHMRISDIVKLSDSNSKESFCELLSSSKSHHLIQILMEKENISFNRREERDILMGVCRNAASNVLKYISGHMKLRVNAKSRGQTPLMLAAETKDSAFVNQMLSLKPDLNAQDDYDESVLHYLCKNGLTSAVEHAIDKGVDVNKDLTYLAEGHLEMVKLLVNRGFDIDSQRCFRRALQNRNEKMVQFFLHRGVEVDAFAVYTACEVGELNIVKMLFEKGATMNMKASDGSTPLQSSCRGHPNVVSYLLKKGASVNQASTVTGDTALHIAAERESAECVDMLLKAGADVTVQNNTGDTPLHRAAGWGSSECVDVLLKAGADVNVQDNTGVTPLHGAAEPTGRGSTECVDVLLKVGADVNVQNNTGDTPLLQATGQGSAECVDMLLKAGADVNVQNNAGDTPLHAAEAAMLGSEETVYVLLKSGADVNVQNNTGDTALHTAAGRGSTECVDVLLKAGADVNVQNDTGDTLLHVAAGQGSEECVAVLLKAGVDVNVQNNTGDTPLHVAAGRGSREHLDVLLKAGADVNV
ncbi:putative ankyrin repeat protein RF_0381, partial [Haliotis rubra]|uniref:putative ankyrin repeat protein RF_0381 n=1 Tax=Haliotis rubra TaxID=36100 RepID=UPI001EE63556